MGYGLVITRLTRKSKMRELECCYTVNESQQASLEYETHMEKIKRSIMDKNHVFNQLNGKNGNNSHPYGQNTSWLKFENSTFNKFMEKK